MDQQGLSGSGDFGRRLFRLGQNWRRQLNQQIVGSA